MATHTHRSPSGYSRWSVCTASPEAIKEFSKSPEYAPEKDDEHSEEGTFAHELFASALDLGLDPREYDGANFYSNDLGESRVVDLEMAEYLSECFERVHDFMPPGSKYWVERKLNLERVTPGEEGTADVSVLEPLPGGKYNLHVFDLKYGAGIIVPVVKNSQLMLYTLGVIDNLLSMEEKSSLSGIHLHILQPRLRNICVWETTRPFLEKFRLEANKKHAETFDPEMRKFVPGEHCRFCAKAIRCQPLKESVFIKVFEEDGDLSFDSFLNPLTLTDDELGEVWPLLDMISAWTKNIKDYMTEQALRGREFKNLKLITGTKGKRAWKNPDDEAIPKFLKKSGVNDDQIYTKTVITPAVAEKKIGRKKMNANGLTETFKNLYNQSDAKPQLAKSDDPRPEYRPAMDDEFDEV